MKNTYPFSKTRHLIVCSLVISGGLFFPVLVQADDGSAGGAAPYLRQGLGARALGMGNAGVAAASDASAAYWNPAALIRLDSPSMASQTALLGLARSWNFINYCQPFRTNRGQYMAGLSWINFSAGSDLEARANNRPDPERTFSDAQNTIMLSGASQVADHLGLGVNAKVLLHQLDTSSASGMSLDLSLWHQPLAEVQWGIMLQDFYSTLRWSESYTERLPLLTRLGAAAELFEGELLLSADGTLEYSTTASAVRSAGIHLGAEFKVLENFFIRGGWDENRWTAGGGLRFGISQWANLRLDYALADEVFPGAGLTQLFSLVMNLLPPLATQTHSEAEK